MSPRRLQRAVRPAKPVHEQMCLSPASQNLPDFLPLKKRSLSAVTPAGPILNCSESKFFSGDKRTPRPSPAPNPTHSVSVFLII